jgi:hypothetical protein
METEKIQRPEKEIRDKQREEDGMERRHGETDDEEVEGPYGRMGRWVMPERFFPFRLNWEIFPLSCGRVQQGGSRHQSDG